MNNPINRDQAKQPQSDEQNKRPPSLLGLCAIRRGSHASIRVLASSARAEGARRVYIGVQEFEGFGFKSFKKFQEV